MQNLKLKTDLIKLSKTDRMYQLDKPLIGLTGGIASGKSTVADLFKQQGVLVINADELIHKIYKTQEALNFIQGLCPIAVENNDINFKVLRSEFFNDSTLKESITKFLYSKLPDAFLTEVNSNSDKEFIIYDVPLLFENKLEEKMDFTITVYIPESLQEQRLINRDRIELNLAKQIISSQMSIEQKKAKADYVIDNSGDLEQLSKRFQILRKQIFL